MYVALRQTAKRQRRRGALGDAFLDNIWQGIENAWNPALQYSNIANAYDSLTTPTPPPPAVQYTQAVANMANVLTSQGVPLPPELNPVTAAAQAASDQAAYAAISGGTAGTAAQTPFGLSLATWAWIILGGTVGLVVLLDKR